MDYFCEIRGIFIKPTNKYEHFKTNIHKEFEKSKNTKLTIENPDIKDVDKAFHGYIVKNIKNFDYYLSKCQFN